MRQVEWKRQVEKKEDEEKIEGAKNYNFFLFAAKTKTKIKLT